MAVLTKEKYLPTLFERLADHAPSETVERQPLRTITTDELRESVARDLESLLNCRCGFSEHVFTRFPESRHSMCSYGMHDFVGLSLANPAHRNGICRSLEKTISIHERRLKQVQVILEREGDAANRLRFVIHALLTVASASGPVLFDVLLQPSTLQYSVSRTRGSIPT